MCFITKMVLNIKPVTYDQQNDNLFQKTHFSLKVLTVKAV